MLCSAVPVVKSLRCDVMVNRPAYIDISWLTVGRVIDKWERLQFYLSDLNVTSFSYDLGIASLILDE